MKQLVQKGNIFGMEYSLCNCAVGSERCSITYKESMIEEYRK